MKYLVVCAVAAALLAQPVLAQTAKRKMIENVVRVQFDKALSQVKAVANAGDQQKAEQYVHNIQEPLVALLDKTFTEAEIKDIERFQNSSAGKKLYSAEFTDRVGAIIMRGMQQSIQFSGEDLQKLLRQGTQGK